MKRQALAAACAAVLFGLAAVGAARYGPLGIAGAQQQVSLATMSEDSGQWVMPSKDYAATRHSSLNQITTENVGNMHAAWSMSTGATRGHEGQPLVIGDTMYFESAYPNNVFAVALADYHIKWQYTPKEDPFAVSVACCDLVNRGVAYGDGKIIVNALDGQVIALDMHTGRPVWHAKNADPERGQTVTAAPLVVKNRVLVGVSGGEFGVRGYLTAFDLGTGRQVWRAYSEGPDSDTLIPAGFPGPHNAGVSTWHGDQWKVGGGTTWGWYSYDPQLDLVYYGTGNPGTWNPTQRPGDNKWSMTIFARRPENGMAVWARQMTPHDEWDFDGVNEMVLVDINKGGKQIPALAHFDRNGFGYTLNRQTGELLVAEKYDPAVNWATKVDMKTGRPLVDKKYSPGTTGPDVDVKGICPAALGSKDEQPSSYDPATGYVLVPTNHVCMTYEPFQVEYTAGQPYVGATLTMFPAPGGKDMGNFIAWDPALGKIVWTKPERFSVWSGALSTDGNVTFYGTLEGYLKAVSTKDGHMLWKAKLPSGIIGNVFTY